MMPSSGRPRSPGSTLPAATATARGMSNAAPTKTRCNLLFMSIPLLLSGAAQPPLPLRERGNPPYSLMCTPAV